MNELSRTVKTIKFDVLVIGLHAYLVISDPMAGKRNRFTVHRVSLAGNKTHHVIGRELTPAQAKKIIQKDSR